MQTYRLFLYKILTFLNECMIYINPFRILKYLFSCNTDIEN